MTTLRSIRCRLFGHRPHLIAWETRAGMRESWVCDRCPWSDVVVVAPRVAGDRFYWYVPPPSPAGLLERYGERALFGLACALIVGMALAMATGLAFR